MTEELREVLAERIDRAVGVDVEVALVPVLKDAGVLKRTSDSRLKLALRLCDGEHTLREIAARTGMGEGELIAKLGELARSGKLEFRSTVKVRRAGR